jgi:hypothetical protein
VDLYESLKSRLKTSFTNFPTGTDARLVMFALNQELTRHLERRIGSKPISAVKLQVINQMMASLMMTEGERRRARLEIERDQTGASGEIVQISDLFKQRLGAN